MKSICKYITKGMVTYIGSMQVKRNDYIHQYNQLQYEWLVGQTELDMLASLVHSQAMLVAVSSGDDLQSERETYAEYRNDFGILFDSLSELFVRMESLRLVNKNFGYTRKFWKQIN